MDNSCLSYYTVHVEVKLYISPLFLEDWVTTQPWPLPRGSDSAGLVLGTEELASNTFPGDGAADPLHSETQYGNSYEEINTVPST